MDEEDVEIQVARDAQIQVGEGEAVPPPFVEGLHGRHGAVPGVLEPEVALIVQETDDLLQPLLRGQVAPDGAVCLGTDLIVQFEGLDEIQSAFGGHPEHVIHLGEVLGRPGARRGAGQPECG